jgi:branched-chain amino acid transport system substrate-binding protein
MLAGAPIAQQARCPAITTFGTNIKVTEVGDYIFRACFIDPFQGKVMAEYAYYTVGARTAGILFNNANDFSVGLTEAFKENFESLGGTIVESQSFSGSDVKDFNVQLTNIKKRNPDVLFAPCMLAELPLILQQARNVGITCPILSGDAADTPELAVMAGVDVVEGLTYTSAFSADSTEPKAVEFVRAYREKFNEVPNSNAVLAYEGTMVMLEAIKNADSLDRTSIRDAMAAIEGLELPSGSISFDENRNPIKGAVILQFQDGVAKFVTSISP